MSKGDFEHFKGEDGLWYWHLQADGNNEIIAHGEGYTSERACLEGIEAVKVNAAPAAEPEGEQP